MHDKRGKLKPESEWVIIEHGQPAIINDTELEALLATGRRRSHEYQRSTAPASYPSPFQGRFYCARCGSRMSLWRKKPGTPWYYLCASKKYGPASCGPGGYLRREEVEGGVMRWLAELLEYPTGVVGEVKRCEQQLRQLSASVAKRIADITARRAQLELERGRWLAVADPTAPVWPDIERRLLELRAEEHELSEEAEHLAENPRAALEAERDAWAEAAHRFEEALAGDPGAMRLVAQGLIGRLEWDPDGEEARMQLARGLPGVPRRVVAPRGFEPLLPE